MIDKSKLIELQENATMHLEPVSLIKSYKEAKAKRENFTCENCTWFKYPPTNSQCIGCYEFDKWRKDE